MFGFKTLAAAAIVALSGGMAAAATVTIEFEGTASGGVYEEDGFTFTSNESGGVNLANCPPTGGCLQMNNNETITVTYGGEEFDLTSFTFRGPGSSGDLTIESDVSGTQVISESLSGNDMQLITFTTEYNDILSFSWTNLDNGSGRVDNVTFTIASVPVPAAGLMLVAGLAGLGAMRRRRRAA